MSSYDEALHIVSEYVDTELSPVAERRKKKLKKEKKLPLKNLILPTVPKRSPKRISICCPSWRWTRSTSFASDVRAGMRQTPAVP